MIDDLNVLASQYVLGLLADGDLRRAEALDASDAGFRREVEFWRRRLSPLDDTAEVLTPAPEMWGRIETSLGSVRAKQDRWRMPWFATVWDSLAFWRAAGVGGVVASFALLLTLISVFAMRPATPSLVAVLVSDENVPSAIVNVFEDGTVELVPLTTIPVPEGKALQVWTLPSRDRGPVSVALLDRARSVNLNLRDLPRTGSGQLFEITLEAKAGSSVGRPTGPILMKGLAVQAL